MGVLEVLAEMVGAEELFGLIALAELVLLTQVFGADVPVWWVGKLFATITAHIVSGWVDVRWVECG